MHILSRFIRQELSCRGIFARTRDIELALSTSSSPFSVLSVVQALASFGVIAKAQKTDDLDLLRLPKRCIVLIKDDRTSHFAYITILDSEVDVATDSGQSFSCSHAKFSKIFQGIYIEVQEDLIETSERKQRWIFEGYRSFCIVALVLSLFVCPTFAIPLIGLVLSYEYIMTTRHMRGVVGLAICGHISRCQSLVKDVGPRLSKVLIFFVVTYFCSRFSLSWHECVYESSFYWANRSLLLFAIIAVGGSLALQTYFWKSCTFCLLIDVLLVIDSITSWPGAQASGSKISLDYYYSVICFAGLLIAIFYTICFLYERSEKNYSTLISLKRNTQIVKTSFRKEEEVLATRETAIPMTCGTDKPINITILLGLHCPFCIDAVKQISVLVGKFPHLMQWEIRISDYDSTRSIEAQELFETLAAVKADLRYNVLRSMLMQKQNLGRRAPLNKEWSLHANDTRRIQTTVVPCVWINGFRLPRGYSISDIRFLMYEFLTIFK